MNRKQGNVEREHVVLNASPCHGQVSRAYAKLYLVEPDGTTVKIGTVCYCPFDDWTDGKRLHCLKPLSCGKSKTEWPAGLDVDRLPVLFHDRGPGSYLAEIGFFILRYRGGWQNLHDSPTDGSPPTPPEGIELIPEAKKLIEWRRIYGDKPKAPRAKPVMTREEPKSKPKTRAAAVKLEADLESVEMPDLEDTEGMPIL